MTMACEDCINRRAFLTAAAGAAGLVAISGCGDGQIGAPLPSRIAVTVADFPGLANLGQLVKVGDVQAAKRTGAASFVAFSMRCTHEGCLTNITNGQRFDCFCHGSRFDANGAVVLGPAEFPLQTIPTSYDPATDTLTIG